MICACSARTSPTTHELAAGKLAALLSRKQARYLFDCSHLFRTGALEPGRLRLAFVLYGAMNRRDWRTVAIEEVRLEIKDFEQKLLPTYIIKMKRANFVKWICPIEKTILQHFLSHDIYGIIADSAGLELMISYRNCKYIMVV